MFTEANGTFARSSLSLTRRRARCACLAAVFAAACASPARAQTAASPPLDQQITALRGELQQTRGELHQTQQQLQQVLSELRQLRRDLGRPAQAPAPGPAQPYISAAEPPPVHAPVDQPAPASVEELIQNQRLLTAQIEEQHQTKLESASRYRVKLSGLVLMNAYSNRGFLDVPDLPNRAAASTDKTGVGATLRQSVLGLQVFGPDFAGARTSANLSVDFFGGFPQAPYGTTAGILRLREAAAHFDWRNTSLTVGQQAPFVTPLSPTSYASLAEPAFSWAGNLWVWTPQAVVEHRFRRSDTSWFALSGGLLLPLTEQPPDSSQSTAIGAGQRSRRPAFAAHAAWNATPFGEPLTVGVGFYASHLKYPFGQQVDGWAVTSDWKLPLGRRFELSGELYRGRAVGGLGGGIWQSVAYNGDPQTAGELRPLNSVGGWSQLKFRLHPQWEMNGALGNDNVLAQDLRWAPVLRGEFSRILARNRATFGNLVFRPRSNLLLAVEYRRLWTWPATGLARVGDHVNLAAGVSF